MDRLAAYTTAKISSLIALLPTSILGATDIIWKSGDLISGRGSGALDVIRDTLIVTVVYAAYLTASNLERNEILDRYGKTEINVNTTTKLPAHKSDKVSIEDFFESEEEPSLEALEKEYLNILYNKPKDRNTLWRLSELYFNNEQYEESLDKLKALKQLSPRDPKVWGRIGDNFKALDQEDDAHKAYAKANDYN